MAQPDADTPGNAAEKAGVASEYTQDAVREAKAAAGQAAERISSLAQDAMADPEKFARDGYLSVARYAREKPLEALAIAAGAAFIVGALWAKR